jgi:hypothetical protein
MTVVLTSSTHTPPSVDSEPACRERSAVRRIADLIFTSTLVYWFVKPLLAATKNAPKGAGALSPFQNGILRTTKKSLLGAKITLLASASNFIGLVLFPMVRQLFARTHTCSSAERNLTRDPPRSLSRYA